MQTGIFTLCHLGFFCGFRDVKTESRAFFFLFVFVLCFSLSWRRGSCSVWLLAECTVHVEMSGERTGEGWGGGVGVSWTQETGKRKCQVLRGRDRVEKRRIRRDQAAGWTVRYVFVVMELCYSWLTWYPSSWPDFPEMLSMEHVGSCQAALIFLRVWEPLWFWESHLQIFVTNYQRK